MVDATRALVRNALENPLNQKFILLSEAGVPLYPPNIMYHQLIIETKSRVMACVTPTVGGGGAAAVAALRRSQGHCPCVQMIPLPGLLLFAWHASQAADWSDC